MKSSCSARGLSASQNLPEITLILSLSPLLWHRLLPAWFSLLQLIRTATLSSFHPIDLHSDAWFCCACSLRFLSCCLTSVWFYTIDLYSPLMLSAYCLLDVSISYHSIWWCTVSLFNPICLSVSSILHCVLLDLFISHSQACFLHFLI